MDIFAGIITGAYSTVTSSIRRFAALVALVLIGILIGARIDQGAAAFIPVAIIISIVLAIVAYVNTNAAITILIGVMLLLLLL